MIMRSAARFPSLAILFAAITFLLIFATPIAAHETTAGSWRQVNCKGFGIANSSAEMVRCGYVSVPLHADQPDGQHIDLATIILPATSKARQADPLFMAQGGPGGSTIDTYAASFIASPEQRPATDRDIILWDQRGTYWSTPRLTCPEVGRQALADARAGRSAVGGDLGAYRACGRRLKALGYDLSAFNSVENANDIDAIRQALGYGAINFYGVSYGSELGQFLMRQHPAAVRSVILDAVVPLNYNLFSEPAFAKQRIANRYFGACARETRCSTAFPALGKRFLALVDRLDKTPVPVSVAGKDGKPIPVRLTGNLFENATYTALYLNPHRLIPLIVDRADKGDFTFLAGTVLPLMLFDEKMADGMHMTVACAERGDTDMGGVDYTHLSPRLAKAMLIDAQESLATCRDWSIDLLPREALTPVRSDIPTLMLSGDFDPITPPHYAASLLPALSKAQHVIFAAGAHGQASSGPCATQIIRSFLDQPDRAVNGRCAQTAAARFFTAGDVVAVPALKTIMSTLGTGGLLFAIVALIPLIALAVFLASAVPVYALGGIVRTLSRKPAPQPRLAPWLATATALIAILFLGGLGTAMLSTLHADMLLATMGLVLGEWRWIFLLPWILGILSAGMLALTIGIWRRHERGRWSRVYFTMLSLAAIFLVALIFHFHLMPAPGA